MTTEEIVGEAREHAREAGRQLWFCSGKLNDAGLKITALEFEALHDKLAGVEKKILAVEGLALLLNRRPAAKTIFDT